MKKNVLGTLIVVAALSGFANVHADDTTKPATQQTGVKKDKADSDHQGRMNVKIDELAQKVGLTDEQKKKVQKAMTANEAEIKATWKNLTDAEFRVVTLEAELLAAIEDAMPEPKKQQFRQKREQDQKKTLTRSSAAKSTADKVKVSSTDKPDPPKTDGKDASKHAASESADHANKSADAKSSGDNGQPQYEETVWTMVIVPVQEQIEHVSLGSDEQRMCDAACLAYHKDLANAYEKIDQSHRKLVELEAARIRSVEKVLTPQQLTKLKENRQKPASKSASNASKKS